MEYRAVGNRCAVDLDSLNLPVSNRKALKILQKKGFRVIDVDLIRLAGTRVGNSLYRRGSRMFEAPKIMDCSSFMKWLYGQRGIWLPRRSIQQRALGKLVEVKNIRAGDLLFVSGRIDYYIDDPADGVGHVGILTGKGTVIHAANKKVNIVESTIDSFIGGKNDFRGIRRYIHADTKVITLQTPPGREIEVSDDIRWVILQSL